jgi:hypothetical protein
MRKTILSVAAAAALAIGGIAAAPQPANAVAWWVVPAIAAGVVGGAAVGVAATNSNAYAYEPGYYGPPAQGVVYAAPSASCHWARVQTADGRLIRQRVCG